MQRRRTHAVVVVSCGDIELASWPVVGDRRPDLATVDELAHIALAARRAGCLIRLRDPCPDLLALVDLAGLREVVGVGSPECPFLELRSTDRQIAGSIDQSSDGPPDSAR